MNHLYDDKKTGGCSCTSKSALGRLGRKECKVACDGEPGSNGRHIGCMCGCIQTWECGEENMFKERSTIVCYGEFAFEFGHPSLICEFLDEMGALLA